MANIGQKLDYESIEERGSFAVAPPADYPIAIINSAYEPNGAKTGHGLKLQLQILDGEFSGTTIWDNLNLDNPNPTTVKIAQQTLKEIVNATGMLGKMGDDTEVLHNIPMLASVEVEPEREEVKDGVKTGRIFKAKNKIVKYKPMGATTAAPTAAAKPAAPTQSAGAAPKAGLPTFLANRQAGK